jgi:Icc-related predicted phosphoesterase
MEEIMDGSFDKMINDIPGNTNVLITHQAPYGFCDEYNGHHCGGRVLRERIDNLPLLRCHLFGHQHEANAMIVRNGTTFSNAAVLDNQYNLIANPRVIEL